MALSPALVSSALAGLLMASSPLAAPTVIVTAPHAPVTTSRSAALIPSTPPPASRPATLAEPSRWRPPVPPLVRTPFDAPAQDWLPGHRGVDLAATPGTPVRAPASGRIVYAGTLAGRGVVSIQHADSPQLRSSYEPVIPVVARGASVEAGQLIATVADQRHSARCATCLHWGVRREETYLDPMSLLVTRIRLLPP